MALAMTTKHGLAVVGLLVGCGGGTGSGMGGSGGAGGTGGAGGGGNAGSGGNGNGGGGGVGGEGGGGGGGMTGMTIQHFAGDIGVDSIGCGDLTLDGTATVKKGAALTVCAGSTVTASKDAKLVIQGKLIVDGSAGKEVTFTG